MGASLNVGTTDRFIRIVLGLALVALTLATGDQAGNARAIAWTAGMVLFATGATGYCPLYALAGIHTRGRVERNRRAATRR